MVAWAMRTGWRAAAVTTVLWLLVAASPAADLRDGGTGLVAAVVDGDTVVLADGREVRLVGIQAPKLPLGRPGFTEQPLAPEAKSALESLILERNVHLSYGGLETDRYSRALAHLHAGDGLWVQGEMLRRGMARVYSFADNRTAVNDMLAIEAEARDARRGIWALTAYAVRNSDSARDFLDSFEIVEGVVLATDEVGGRVYLNFDEDWRTDFTVSIAPRDARKFRAEGIEPLDYAGLRIRVRGWLRNLNGPMIDVTHPEQIESLDR